MRTPSAAGRERSGCLGEARIGLDYGPALSHGPGVGRYARELVRALVQLPEAPPLLLLDLSRGPRAGDIGEPGLESALRPPRITARPIPRRVLELAGRLGLGAERLLGGVDLFHDLRREPLPVRRARRTWALSELPEAGSRESSRLRAQARAMDALIAFSEHGTTSLAALLDVPPERIHRTPVGAEHFCRDLRPAPPAPAGERPYALVLGRLDRARRPLEVLAAVDALRAGGLGLGLVFAGRRGDAGRELGRAFAASRPELGARWIEDPGERALPGLVARAAVLVHLSAGELTAVTPLEALALGVPVVASRLPAFEEALGSEARWIEPHRGPEPPSGPDPGRVALLAAAIDAALAERDDPLALARRRARAAPYTWEACARATLAIWRGVLERDA